MFRRVRHWTARREANRLMLGAGVLALAMLLSALLLGLALSRWVAQSYGQTLLDLRISNASSSAVQRLLRIEAEVVGLSRSSFVVNALSDSAGRDVYLGPFLRQHPLQTLGARLTVCNGVLEQIGADGAATLTPAPGCGDVQQAQILLDQGQGNADLLTDARGQEWLRLRVPIRLPQTGTHEGLVTALVPLNQLMGSGEAQVTSTGFADPGASADNLRAGHALQLPATSLLAPLPLAVQASLPAGLDRIDLRPVVLVYLALGLLLAALAVALAAYLARQWVRPLKALAALSQHASHGNRVRLTPALDTPNEVGELARAIRQMSEDMVQANERLKDQVDELVEARNNAHQAAVAKSEFLAVMSHEIRTPMNAVIGLLYLALRHPLDAAQHDRISRAHRSAGGLLRVINDILDFSKIDSGKLQMERAPFSPAELLSAVADVVQMPAAEKGLLLQVELDPALPPLLLGDTLRLRQVLINLAGNAVKFTDRGHVRLRLQCGPREPGRCELQALVEDTGIGLSATQQQALFQPFVQVDSSASRRFTGTGLGLAISSRLLRLMGGALSVHSDIGVGSRFTFSVPLECPDDAAAGAAAAGPGPVTLRRCLVLVVDDNEVNRLVASEMLAMLGLPSLQAENGEQALSVLAADERIGAVLLDCHMPVLDGYQTARRIREQPRWKGLPVIALTADVSEGEREACLAAGMNDHLGKPMQMDALSSTLQRWIGAPAPAEAAFRPDAPQTATPPP